MKRSLVLTLIVALFLLSACKAPAPTPTALAALTPASTALAALSTPAPTAPPALTSAPSASPAPMVLPPTPSQPAKNAVGGISDSTVKVVHDPSSGPECSADAAYLVTMNITSSGATTAQYVLDATDGSGQVANGVFDTFDKPEVTDALTFNGAETITFQLKLKGPFSYADSVTIRAKVNGKNLDVVTVPCAPASAAAAATVTASPLASPAAACDAAQFISDVTVADNTVFTPGQIFTKTWRLKNVGTCTWDGNYTVNADSGPGMTQNSVYLLSKVSSKSTVAPGDTLDISIDMQASNTPGTYQTFWRLQNGAGNVIPVAGGVNAKLFYVQIIVNAAGSASGGNITTIVPQIVQEQGSGKVCAAATTYFVYVDISADGAATANYRIDATDDSGQAADGVFDSSGTPEVTGSQQFSAAGTQRISLRLTGPYSYPDKITIRVKVNAAQWQNVLVACQ